MSELPVNVVRWDLVEANLDFGVFSGYFVRLDIEMADGSGSLVMPCLDPQAARTLAAALVAVADHADARNGETGHLSARDLRDSERGA